MTVDPDLLAIQRQRRQQGRCLHCGTRTPRAALCAACRETRRYCPRCEVVWELDRPRRTPDGRSSAYCPPCGNITRNGPRPSRQRYLAAQRGADHPLLSEIIRRYRAGESYNTIARALQIPRGTVSSLITHARATGRWPARLARGRGWRWKKAR